MKNKKKYNKKYQISYKTDIKENGYSGYTETIYLYPDESNIDLIRKIEKRIRSSNTKTIYEYKEVKI